MEIKELYEIYKAHPVVTTDSRNCPEGSIFFALKGETFDGNKFAMQALEKGCAYAVVDDLQVTLNSSPVLGEVAKPEGFNTQLIVVENVLDTLQQLARYHREQLDIPFVGITGTNGKTTTKELVATVLSKKYRVHYTQGNFNNHIGVPLTLLSIKPDCEIAVVEMGANHPGEIKTLANIALPTCGLITNVGKAHLEGFGSLEGVINTKKELYDNLVEHGGHVFVNAANPYLTNIINDFQLSTFNFQLSTYSSNPDVMADVNGRLLRCAPYVEFEWHSQLSTLNSQLSTYSSNPDVAADVNGRLLRCAPYVEFEWHSQLSTFNSQLSTCFVGAYNLDNMLAAIAVGLHFGVDEKDVCDAISNYVPANNRSQLTKTERNTLIVDAYNANPTSMMAAIDNFDLMEGENKVAILGDMLELGEQSTIEHQNILRRLMESKIEKIILVGKEFKAAYSRDAINCVSKNEDVYSRDAIHCVSADKDICVFDSQVSLLETQCIASLQSRLILLKGSNGIGLYKLIPYL
ncbi:MAG: UDP-N-acetylmuramoyl-tripeptide--D-alanyl-D-alanine ligase [Paludibacteraceae bacterium]|nr:UDP-N-acetylmuramoyl-tripeptide--D-alanyl-D-alanine ligase [Paludibacteraceae bacterium]